MVKMISNLKILSIISAACLLFVPVTSFADKNNGIISDIKYTQKIAKSTYLVHFDVCSTSLDSTIPKITVKSSQEIKEIKTKKIMKPNTCQSFDVIIKAKNVKQIEVITQ